MDTVIIYIEAIIFVLVIFLPSTFLKYLVQKNGNKSLAKKIKVIVLLWIGLVIVLYFLVSLKLFIIAVGAGIVLSISLWLIKRLFLR